jgi:hypothetical protein
MQFGYQGKDLSAIHHPISNLFTQPNSAEEWDQYRLSQDQIEFFQENGYLAIAKGEKMGGQFFPLLSNF